MTPTENPRHEVEARELDAAVDAVLAAREGGPSVPGPVEGADGAPVVDLCPVCEEWVRRGQDRVIHAVGGDLEVAEHLECHEAAVGGPLPGDVTRRLLPLRDDDHGAAVGDL